METKMVSKNDFNIALKKVIEIKGTDYFFNIFDVIIEHINEMISNNNDIRKDIPVFYNGLLYLKKNIEIVKNDPYSMYDIFTSLSLYSECNLGKKVDFNIDKFYNECLKTIKEGV